MACTVRPGAVIVPPRTFAGRWLDADREGRQQRLVLTRFDGRFS